MVDFKRMVFDLNLRKSISMNGEFVFCIQIELFK